MKNNQESKNKFIYNEQLNNCILCLIISIIFILGLIYKTFTNAITIVNIQNMLFIILPVIFLNTNIFVLLKVFKNTLKDNDLFSSKNKKLLNTITYVMIIFFLSLVLIIRNDINRINNLYCIFLISTNFLISFNLLKKIFNYEIEKKEKI